MQSPTDHEPSTTAALGSIDAVADLVASFGAYSSHLHRAIALLVEQSLRLDSLIRISGLSRRTIEQLLSAAGSDIEQQDTRYSLRADVAQNYRQRFNYDKARQQHDLFTEAVATSVTNEISKEIAGLVSEAPAAKEQFDHIVATPETALRRAVWLDETYDLRQTHLLYIGDHDLTSLASCLVNPNLEACVVDIDEDLLAYIDQQARRLGLNVRCYYTDLRFSLPPELTTWADVIFTDPPYSPEGIKLFASRSLEGLRSKDFGNIVISYGFGEQLPTLGLKVQ